MGLDHVEYRLRVPRIDRHQACEAGNPRVAGCNEHLVDITLADTPGHDGVLASAAAKNKKSHYSNYLRGDDNPISAIAH
jgi:hypothetical protein